MKVHGNYYKKSDPHKSKTFLERKDFELEVKDADSIAMRTEATEKLIASDPDFRGLREFFVETINKNPLVAKETPKGKKLPIRVKKGKK